MKEGPMSDELLVVRCQLGEGGVRRAGPSLPRRKTGT